ncbi:cytochrome P450 [Haloactinomyces albus]|uniref:Cytochrome P450 n=1 Tax=Haloactinomyces albus TaxID=1352928 RepID=A0AAE4CMP7_9ACTN|nr:cytochrome P450 [Haloactinomyces albus]MDR7303625.1 cytochrome P450 [Haloactinomyces albus]
MTAMKPQAPSAPIADWVALDALHADPFPIYTRLRAEAPVAWVPAANRYLVTRYADVHTVDADQDTFSADESHSLMKRAMGHSMLRKDGPAHQRERKAAGVPLRPNQVKQRWTPIFRRNAEELINRLRPGGGAELVDEFAAPFAARNLAEIVGLPNASARDMRTWSQTMIDGTGNYANDPDVWARAERSYYEVDEALDEMIPHLRANPDGSMVSAMLHADDPLDIEEIRANVKMTIGGGLNEPRDVLGVAVHALLAEQRRRDRVMADQSLFASVFDESVRYVAPIGMYPRQTTREVELGGTLLPAGARLGVVVGSANRDERQFSDPDIFDINREKKPHVAFGGGAHYCLGAWAAKASVATVALPMLFDRLPHLRLDPDHPAQAAGWVFRGMTELPVVWDL